MKNNNNRINKITQRGALIDESVSLDLLSEFGPQQETTITAIFYIIYIYASECTCKF